MPEQHSQPTLTLLGQGCMCVYPITCHLHFWQNDRGLLHATVVRQGWNRLKVRSALKADWRRKFFHCFCQESNPHPFNHEFSALATELSRPLLSRIIRLYKMHGTLNAVHFVQLNKVILSLYIPNRLVPILQTIFLCQSASESECSVKTKWPGLIKTKWPGLSVIFCNIANFFHFFELMA